MGKKNKYAKGAVAGGSGGDGQQPTNPTPNQPKKDEKPKSAGGGDAGPSQAPKEKIPQGQQPPPSQQKQQQQKPQPPPQQQQQQQGSQGLGPQPQGAWGSQEAAQQQQQGRRGQDGPQQQGGPPPQGQGSSRGGRGGGQQQGGQRGQGGPQQGSWGQRGQQQQSGQQQQQKQQQQAPQQPYGGQQQQGAGVGQQRQPQSQPPSSSTSRSSSSTPAAALSPSTSKQSLTAEMSKMSITQPAKMPIYVPSKGICLDKGTKGRPFQVETNSVALILDKMKDKAYQYDVKIDPDKPKKFMRLVFEQFRYENCPQIHMAYDGRASAYSPCKLPREALRATEVQFIEPDNQRTKSYTVTLQETVDSTVELNTLKTYQKSRIFDKPMRALQCLEVVLSAPCHNKGVRAGRSFYVNPERPVDLDDGYELWLGLFQAAVLGDQPFFNIDVCHKAFPKKAFLLDVVSQYRYANLQRGLEESNLRQLNEFLKGLNVVYNPPKSFNALPKTYKYNNLKRSASVETFKTEDGKTMTVAEYFNSKGYQIRYPNLPCLWVGSTIRNIYLPLELIEIPSGQATMKQAGERQVRAMISYAATSTDERKRKIMHLFQKFNHNVNETVRAFGVQLGQEFIKVTARLLDIPRMEYFANKTVVPFNGNWRLTNEHFLKTWNTGQSKPAEIKWSVLVCERLDEHYVRDFADALVKTGVRLNVHLARTYDVQHCKSFPRDISNALSAFKRNQCVFVFVVISNASSGYAYVKQESELRNGILTQCIKRNTVERRNNQQTLQNIMLKINAKLNGSNHKVVRTPSQGQIFNNKHVMFIGADVTHPSPGQTRIPSVVGVAASHDLFGTQYNMQYRLQDSKQEIIDDFENILYHHMCVYKSKNKQFPQTIIYYRDGVADGQFPEVSSREFSAMDKAIAKVKAQSPEMKELPKITCIIVQKRHHTRFFPGKADALGKFNNVKPGTVVDSKITHPNESQFFMVSHESIQGTAKPTKYCIIRDDAKINIDNLQELTYHLCHLFPRCNRAVSYPAPAYLAHLVAARGRVYIEGPELRLPLKEEYRRRSIMPEIIDQKPMFFV